MPAFPRLRMVFLSLAFAALAVSACGGDAPAPARSDFSNAGLDGIAIFTPEAMTSQPAPEIAPPAATETPPPSPTPAPPSPTPPPPAPPRPAAAVVATPAPPVQPVPTQPSPPGPAVAPAVSAAAAPPAAQAPPAPGLVSFQPEQIVQGGYAFVYLNADATNATLSFGGKQYPMARENGRWWAIVGIGALAATGNATASVSYTTPGGATTSASAPLPIVGRQFPLENITLSPSSTALLAPDIVNAELAQRSAIYAQYSAQRLWSGPFVRPSAAALSDEYGVLRSYNGAPPSSYHTGVDFAGLTGSPVLAAAAGRVAYAGEMKVRGGSVIIDHGMGLYTAYHHFSQINVAQGQMVSAGQNIGLVGETGLATGPHLHWEVIIRGVEVDGLMWLRGAEIAP